MQWRLVGLQEMNIEARVTMVRHGEGMMSHGGRYEVDDWLGVGSSEYGVESLLPQGQVPLLLLGKSKPLCYSCNTYSTTIAMITAPFVEHPSRPSTLHKV